MALANGMGFMNAAQRSPGMGGGCACSAGQPGMGLDGGLGGMPSMMMSMMAAMMAMLTSGMMSQLLSGQGGALASGQNPGFGAGGAPSMGNAAQGFLGGSPGAGNGGGSAAPAAGGAGGQAGPAGAATGQLVDRPGGKIDSSIAANFDSMVAAAKKDGVNLQINSGHRSRAEQEKLYAAYKNGTGNLAAKPGTSNHEKGQAIDFKNNPGAYNWLAKNAQKFGFKNLPGEPWHYSPTGG